MVVAYSTKPTAQSGRTAIHQHSEPVCGYKIEAKKKLTLIHAHAKTGGGENLQIESKKNKILHHELDYEQITVITIESINKNNGIRISSENCLNIYSKNRA